MNTEKNQPAELGAVLLAQWDEEKNAPLTPKDVSAGSRRKLWWRCRQGHSWQARVESRTRGAGCPYCAGRKVLPGFNDLATLYPSLAAQWHPDQNGPLDPSMVTAGSRRKAAWLCPVCGTVWQAAILSRTNGGSGCPVCSGRQAAAGVNDLKTRFPSVAAQWDTEKNGPLTPEEVTPFSNRRVWWRCERGHSYHATIAARTGGSGCPYCTGRRVLPGFNDLATLRPLVAAQWHPELNDGLTPEQVTVSSHKKVWWLCPEGHVWKAAIYPRTGPQQCGCPLCAGRSGTRPPKKSKGLL